MKTKNTVLFLVCLLLAAVFAGCGNGGEKPENTTNSDDSKLEASLSILPKIDYEGYDFVITYRDLYNSVDDMAFSQDNDNVLDKALYDRAMKVMDYYHVNIVPNVIQGDWAGQGALESLMVGDNDYDIIMPHSHIAWGTYITNGYALEWTENMKYNHLDQAWWDQGAYECLSVGNKYYTMLGDFSWKLTGSSVGVLFNKAVFDEVQEKYPYEYVDNMTWTFDVFHEIARRTVKDMDGDGQITLGNDRLGYTTGLYMGPVGFLWTTGNGIIGKDGDDMPYLDVYHESTVNLYDKFFKMMGENGFYIYNNRDSFNTQFHQEFAGEQVVMIDTMIENISQLRNMYDWGIVPYPMFTESVGRYYSTADAGVHSPIIPYNTKNPDRTSMVLEALAIEGYNQVIPAFYDVTLQIKYTDDDKSRDMLDLIRSTRRFDLGYYTGSCGGEFALVGTKLFLEGTSFTNYYAKYEQMARESVEDFVSSLTDN